MKFKLITIMLLGLSLTACGEETPKSLVTIKDGPSWKRERICERTDSEKYPFDFEYTFGKTGGQQQFSRKITQEERDQFYNFILDHQDSLYLGEKERFNRKRPEPKFNPTEKYKWEQKIKVLLDECVALVGPAQNDKNYDLDKQNGVYFQTLTHTKDKEYADKIQHHYLSGRMRKCEAAVYPYIYPPEPIPCDGAYDGSNFEYKNPNEDPKIRAKQTILEKKYENIYLNVRAAGLLRQMAYTYYPKSFLREHADQTGLTKYIQQEEKKAGYQLKHNELAKEYFGSYEKWMKSLDKFFDKKITDLKIGI